MLTKGLIFHTGTSDEDGWVNGSNVFYIKAIICNQQQAEANRQLPFPDRTPIERLSESVVFEGKCPPIEEVTSGLRKNNHIMEMVPQYKDRAELFTAFEAFWKEHRESVEGASDSAGQFHRGPFNDRYDPFTRPTVPNKETVVFIPNVGICTQITPGDSAETERVTSS